MLDVGCSVVPSFGVAFASIVTVSLTWGSLSGVVAMSFSVLTDFGVDSDSVAFSVGSEAVVEPLVVDISSSIFIMMESDLDVDSFSNDESV